MNLVDDLAPGLPGIDALGALIASGGRPPIGETLDFALAAVGDGWAVFTSTPDVRVYNPIGSVHGGYAAALLDSACGCAVHTKLDASQAYTTLDLKVSYHRGITANTGPLRAEGRVQTFGRRVAFAEATLTDVNGRLLASATSTLLVMER